MRRQIFILGLLSLSLTVGTSDVYSQGFLNKLRDKTADKAANKILGQDDQSKNASTPDSKNQNSPEMKNSKGGGLSHTTPDVTAQIKAAQDALASGNYSGARYAARQALMGIELEIGQLILKSLPEKADGISFIPEEDNVTSSGIGFVGLVIQRNYRSADKELKVSVLNNSVLLTSINLYLSSGGYSSTQDSQNMKQVNYKGYRAVLQYDENSGYTLSIPFGQTSLLTIQGINYSDENTLMSAANYFDPDKIKREFGES